MAGGCGLLANKLEFDLRLERGGQVFDFFGRVPLRGVTGIMGPSGSGKTTLLRGLAGLEPTEGYVLFDEEIWQDEHDFLDTKDRRIGLVFQDGRLFDHLDVGDNIAYGRNRRGLSPEAPDYLLDLLGVADLIERMPNELSGGQIRRVALARALASEPSVLFLDEPLSALDDDARETLLPFLHDIVRVAKIPVLYVSHDVTELDRLAERILLIEDGKVAGWWPEVPRIQGEVSTSRDGAPIFDLGSAAVMLPSDTPIGARGELYLPRTPPVVATSDPGDVQGGFAIPCTLASPDTPTFSFGGQPLDFPGLTVRIDLPIGTRVWLIFAQPPRFQRRG